MGYISPLTTVSIVRGPRPVVVGKMTLPGSAGPPGASIRRPGECSLTTPLKSEKLGAELAIGLGLGFTFRL